MNPLPPLAQGTATRRTPHLLQRIRGTRAVRYASCWKKFKCRQVFSSVSYAWTPDCHSRHTKVLPRGKSNLMSSRFCSGSNSTADTLHGGVNPRANWKRSMSLIMHGDLPPNGYSPQGGTHTKQRGTKNKSHVSFSPRLRKVSKLIPQINEKHTV